MCLSIRSSRAQNTSLYLRPSALELVEVSATTLVPPSILIEQP